MVLGGREIKSSGWSLWLMAYGSCPRLALSKL